MRLAGFIQRKMIPEEAPRIRGLDVAATYIPCFEVGGDFYDFLKVSDTSVAVAIGDVMGKGMPAALMMSCFRSAVRAYVDSGDGRSDIAGLIEKLNRMVCRECGDGEFLTLFYAVIDTAAGAVTYCNCGHEPTILIGDGGARDLDVGGLVLGVDAGEQYDIETVAFREGDCLLFYTDVLIDAANFDGDLWGRESLLAAAAKFTGDSAGQMVKDILGYRRRFVGLARQIDDTSMVVVKNVGARAPAKTN